MQKEKILSLLHLTRKAGKLQFGFDACERSCLRGKAKLLIYASDLKDKRKRDYITLAEAFNVKIIEFASKQTFQESFKIRKVGILSIEDKNFAKGITAKMEEQ